MPFDAEQNEIEYEDAMTEQAAAITTGAVARAELDWANRKIDQLRTDLATANATIAKLTDELAEAAICASVSDTQVAQIVSRIEDEKVTALRAELASLKRQVDEAESKTTLCYACNAEVEKLAFRLAEIETENSNG